MNGLPPFGVMPESLWHERIPEPTLLHLVVRHHEVMEAVDRYREAGREPDPRWLIELGVRSYRGWRP